MTEGTYVGSHNVHIISHLVHQIGHPVGSESRLARRPQSSICQIAARHGLGRLSNRTVGFTSSVSTFCIFCTLGTNACKEVALQIIDQARWDSIQR